MYTVEELIKTAIAKRGLNQKKVAEGIGLFQQQLSAQVRNRRLRADVFMKALDYMGYDLVVRDRKTGRELAPDDLLKKKLHKVFGDKDYSVRNATRIGENESLIAYKDDDDDMCFVVNKETHLIDGLYSESEAKRILSNL